MALGKFTDIIFLLDRSSSMRSMAGVTISSFNEFIEGQKAIPGEARLTLAQFAAPGDFAYTYFQTPLNSTEGLTHTNYRPDGYSTALRDAICRLIDDVGTKYAGLPEGSRPEKVVFVILTDGQENSSRLFSNDDVRRRITRQTDVYKWEFVFLGANQDAILAAQEFSIAPTSAMTYAVSEQGIYNTSKSLNDKIGTYRQGLTRSVAFDDTDRANALKSDKK